MRFWSCVRLKFLRLGGSEAAFCVLWLFIFCFWGARIQGQKIKVACIGNSVTYGYGLARAEDAYPAQLQRRLGSRYEVRNFGVNGATLLSRGHKPYIKTEAFRKLKDFNPDIALIHLGLNDTDPRNWPRYKDEFEADYYDLLDTLKGINPKVKRYICTLTPIFSGHSRFTFGTAEWYHQIQEKILRIAALAQVPLIDLNAVLRNRPDLLEDNLHPDARGAALICDAVFSKLTGDYGGLSLVPYIMEHMVLQRDRPIIIRGRADSGMAVAVRMGRVQAQTKADSDGKWRAVLPSLSAGGPFVLRVSSENQNINLSDIWIGDVWLCSGQSNMDFPLKKAIGGLEQARQTPSAPVRLWHLYPTVEPTDSVWEAQDLEKINELHFFEGKWQRAEPIAAQNFSAIGYTFGLSLAQEVQVPVGLVQLSVGGSGIESWIDRTSLERHPVFVHMMDNWRTSDFLMPWVRARADRNLEKAKSPKQRHPFQPAYNAEAGLERLRGMAIKGVLWYQGESNVHNPEMYRALFKTWVKSWRSFFEDARLPVYLVQLSGVDRAEWPYFRVVQSTLQRTVPYTWLAVSMDKGDSLEVHPKDKIPIGRRLLRLALQHSYGRNIDADPPVAGPALWHEDRVDIPFLTGTPLKSSADRLVGFEWVDTRGRAMPAEARLVSGDTVSVYFPKNAEVREIRYGWMAPFTRASLISAADMPAGTFYIKK